MDRSLMDAIRQQSDDLRDELKDLEMWEEEIGKKVAARKSRKVPGAAEAGGVEPPVRGTVPSIKQAMAQEAKQQGKQLPPEQDPIQLAKEKGNEYFRVGKTSDAIEAYTQGINLDPQSATTHVLYGNRAMAYIKLGEWAKAEKDATTCVQMNRGYAKAYFRRAVARKNMGNLKEARSDLESVLALVPNDSSALAELEEVTKKLQAARAQATTQAPKKRIVIEEVDDEDEEEAGGDSTDAAAAATTPDSHAAERQQRVEKELEEARKAHEEARQAEVRRQESLMNARSRGGASRVEVIEEEEEEKTPPPPVSAQASHSASSATKTTTKPPVHVDVSPAAAAAAKADKNGAEEKPPVAKEAASRPKKADPVPSVTMRNRGLPAKESLKAPNSLSDFERVFPTIEKDDDLRNYYVSLMDPNSLPSLFGSNLTPEMLVGMLKSVKSMPGETALKFLKGLGKVNRVGELALFFEKEEEQLVTDVLAHVKASGVSEKELAPLVKTFKPL